VTIGDAGSQSAPISRWAAARTASRQILRGWATPPSRTPLQLPILVCDVRDAGLYRVVGTLVHALRDPIEHKLPLVRVPVLVTRGSREPIVPAAWAATATRLLPLGELAVIRHRDNQDSCP
jgi:pimeloyl-ACP methyl ester carboxylesterase